MSPSSNTITENFDKIYAEGFEEGYAEAKNDMIKEIVELKKTVKEHDSDNDVLIENIEKLMKERSDNFLSSSLKMAELNKQIDDFRGKAKAWKLITQDANWENLALLCDKEMAKELVKTGECDWEDFEFCEFSEEEEEDEVCSTCHKQLEGDDKCSAGCPEYDAGCNQEEEEGLSYEDDPYWDECKECIVDEGEMILNMSSDLHTISWSYVINKSGMFIRGVTGQSGQYPINGKLVSTGIGEGSYVCDKINTYSLKEGEMDVYNFFITDHKQIMDL